MVNSFLDVVPESESPFWAYPLFQDTDYYPIELRRLIGLKQHGPGLQYHLGPSERSRFLHSRSVGALGVKSKDPSIMFTGIIHDAASFSPPHIFELMTERTDPETLYSIATGGPSNPWADIRGNKIPGFIDDFTDKAGVSRKELLEPIRNETSPKTKISREIDNLDAAVLGDSRAEFSRKDLKRLYENIEIWVDDGKIFIPGDTPTPTGEPIDQFVERTVFTRVTCYNQEAVVIKDSAPLAPVKLSLTARGKIIKDRYGRDFDFNSLYLMEDKDWSPFVDQLDDVLCKELMAFAYTRQPDFDRFSSDYGVRDVVVKAFNGVDADSEAHRALEDFRKASQLQNMADVDRRIYERTGLRHVAVSAYVNMPESVRGILVEYNGEPVSITELHDLRHKNGYNSVAFIAVYGERHHSPEVPQRESQRVIRSVLADKGFASFLSYPSRLKIPQL